MLALATVVTAGSMYVTVRAAAQQESAEFNPAAQDATANVLQATPAVPDNAPSVPGIAGDVNIPDVQAVLDQLDAALDKSRILRDRQNHVILDENGGFKGKLSSLSNSDGASVSVSNVKVTLLHHGAEVGSTTTDTDGRFSFTGLPEGVVAVWAEGENSLMLFSFVLFGHGSNVTENQDLQAAQVELGMDSAVASGPDIATVKELIGPYLNTEEKRFTNELATDDQEFSFGSSETSTTLRKHRVRLHEGGVLKGEVNVLDERTGRHREVLDMTVHFVRNGERVVSAEVSNDGSFSASGLSAGVHSVVAVGQDGILVSCVEIVSTDYEKTADNSSRGDHTTVSIIADSLDFIGCPVRPVNIRGYQQSNETGTGGIVGQEMGTPFGQTPGGGGYAGGGGSGFSGGGGGGGIGGGGGLGALLAGGIGGAIGYLAGQNNNPASPGL